MANFISLNLKSIGQVMLQGNPITGLLFLLGIAVAAYADNSIELLLSTLLCTLVANLVAIALKAKFEHINDGLYGYNGTLIGIAGAVFFEASFKMYGLVTLGTLVSVGIMFFMLEKLSRKISFPALTFPFVLITWVLFLIVHSSLPSLLKKTSPLSVDSFILSGFLKSVSQVFVLENFMTGILFLVGIFINSLASGISTVIGGGVFLALGVYLGEDSELIAHGVFGYNAVLTAITLGSVLFKTKKEAIIYTTIGLGITLVYQNILSSCFKGLGLPILTAPFIFAVWSVLLLRKIGLSKKTKV